MFYINPPPTLAYTPWQQTYKTLATYLATTPPKNQQLGYLNMPPTTHTHTYKSNTKESRTQPQKQYHHPTTWHSPSLSTLNPCQLNQKDTCQHHIHVKSNPHMYSSQASSKYATPTSQTSDHQSASTHNCNNPQTTLYLHRTPTIPQTQLST